MVEIFNDSSLVKIFQFLASNKGCHTIIEIHKKTNIPVKTIYRRLLDLNKLKIIKKVRYQTALKIYSYKYEFNETNNYSLELLKIMKLLEK